MKEIWLVRHGETEWSLSGQHTGRTDIPLTSNGQEQAATLIPVLKAASFAQVLTSPLQRARETARIAGFPDAELEPNLMEWDYGDYEGRTSADIHENDPDWTIWFGAVPKGESITQAATRTRAVLERCGEGRTALFAHGHILRVLAACWLGLEPTEGRLLALSTASVSVLGYEHETRVIKVWNETNH